MDKIGTHIILTVQERKIKFRKVKELARRHTESSEARAPAQAGWLQHPSVRLVISPRSALWERLRHSPGPHGPSGLSGLSLRRGPSLLPSPGPVLWGRPASVARASVVPGLGEAVMCLVRAGEVLLRQALNVHGVRR